MGNVPSDRVERYLIMLNEHRVRSNRGNNLYFQALIFGVTHTKIFTEKQLASKLGVPELMITQWRKGKNLPKLALDRIEIFNKLRIALIEKYRREKTVSRQA